MDALADAVSDAVGHHLMIYGFDLVARRDHHGVGPDNDKF
jgi:hypothetical protein